MRVTVAKTVTVTLISLLSACASQTKDDLLPQTGPTMEEVYRNHENNLSAGTSTGQSAFAGIRERQAGNHDADLEGYTRDANHEIQQQFPRLPNPTLVMLSLIHI